MKDLVIRKKRIKTELTTLLVCFVVGFVANIAAIIYYKSSWVELFTSLHYVLLFTLFVYLVWSVLRFVFLFIKYAFYRRKKNNKTLKFQRKKSLRIRPSK